MKKKRKHAEVEATPEHAVDEPTGNEDEAPEQAEPTRKFKKSKQVFTRVAVDPSKKYFTPESRESWGPNVKGKKFRKEKGKKKRCPNAGVRIDGSVKSVRLDL